jgi:hypothetical protein
MQNKRSAQEKCVARETKGRRSGWQNKLRTSKVENLEDKRRGGGEKWGTSETQDRRNTEQEKSRTREEQEKISVGQEKCRMDKRSGWQA